jgi:predicted RNA-binding Zn ribbon-like protein
MLHRPPAMFVADAPALDFLNSVATPVDERIDWLDSGEGLLSWLLQAEMIAEADLEAVRAQALPGEIDSVAAQARSLREWFRGFVDAHKGAPLSVSDVASLEPINRLLERDEVFKRIVPGSSPAKPMDLVVKRRWRSAEALLQPIGETLGRFVCEENFTLVRACQGQNCTLMFADHTRRGDRRWCSMAVCGNRAKQQEYRERKKARG